MSQETSAQRQARFAAAAERSEQHTLSSGKAHSLDVAFDYLRARLTRPKVMGTVTEQSL